MENILRREAGTGVGVGKGLGEEKKKTSAKSMVAKGYCVWEDRLERSEKTGNNGIFWTR